MRPKPRAGVPEDGISARIRARLEAGGKPGDEGFVELAEAYLRLEERLDKIIAIGDKYQADVLETSGRLRDALSQLEALKLASGPGARVERRESGAPGGERPADPLASRLRASLAEGKALSPAEIGALLDRCEKLNARMDKIVTISDRYQSQLRDISARMDFMARTDPLTNLSNRRDMVERLDREVLRFERYGTSFSVILFDIDDFKRVNDHFGHDAGDRVLKGVAFAFLRELRRSDGCSRWGGEEFLLLCPETGIEEARVVAEKCRQAVAALAVESVEGEIRITLSGGVAAMSEGLSRDSLIQLADQGLYRAKAAGKNTLG
jgi:diguanylate cyclase (GGDEF)-like protein